MPRRNGSYFGFTVNPTPSVASGIWRVREAEEYLRVNKWPATPGVPGSPTGTAGNEEVSLTWSAPTLGSPPTDYEVQYSSNAGSTWTTFSDGVGTTTSATVTGLTNGTGYIFRVRALNALGEGPYGSASGTITPQALNVTLLLHFDGSNGSQVFTDSSPSNLECIANGTAEISTTESKFGGASGRLYGASGYVSIADDPALEFGSDDFTIEMWVNLASAYNTNTLYGKLLWPDYEHEMVLYVFGGSTYLVVSDSNDGWDINGGGSITVEDNSWTHIALVRHGNQIRVYVDGVVSQEHTFTGSVNNGTGEARIGGDGFDGYIDELRIVKGTAIYTDTFTPPTAPF